MQGSLRVEQAPHLAPRLAGQLRRGVTERRWRPLAIPETSRGAPQRQGWLAPLRSGFGWDGVLA